MDIVALGDIAEIAAGGGAPQNPEAFSFQGSPFIRAGSLNTLLNGGSEAELEQLTEAVAKIHGLRRFPANTVIFAKSGMSATKGHVYRLRSEAYVVNHLAALVPNRRVDPRFLEHALRFFSPTRLIQDAAYPSIRLSDIGAMKLPLPSIAEQRRIAAILAKADELRAKRSAIIAKVDDLIAAVFFELLGNPVTNPRHWREERMENFFFFRTGKLDSNAAVPSGEYPFFTCSREDLRIDKYAFDCEALLLAGNNASADYSVKHYKGKFNAYQRTYVITLRDEGNSYSYARFVLEYRLAELKRMSKGTNTKYLTLELLNRISIPVPPKELQQAFEHQLAAIEKIGAAYRRSLENMDALLDSLQHRAFRGEL